jgi:hypothetical protein
MGNWRDGYWLLTDEKLTLIFRPDGRYQHNCPEEKEMKDIFYKALE